MKNKVNCLFRDTNIITKSEMQLAKVAAKNILEDLFAISYAKVRKKAEYKKCAEDILEKMFIFCYITGVKNNSLADSPGAKYFSNENMLALLENAEAMKSLVFGLRSAYDYAKCDELAFPASKKDDLTKLIENVSTGLEHIFSEQNMDYGRQYRILKIKYDGYKKAKYSLVRLHRENDVFQSLMVM